MTSTPAVVISMRNGSHSFLDAFSWRGLMRISSAFPWSVRRRLAWWRLVFAVLPLAAACQGDHLTPPPPIDPAILYWDLSLNHEAVTLSTTAPYDTLTLIATPRNAAGEPLLGLPTPVFRSTDPARVVVTHEGVLIAAQVTSQPIAVIATITTDNLKHEDTVRVRVVADPAPPVVSTFSIQPVPPDSAKSPETFFFYYYLLNRLVRVADAGGAPLATTTVDFDPSDLAPVPVSIPDVLVSFQSSDTNIAKIERRSAGNGLEIFALVGYRRGAVKIYATTTLFGVKKVDTLDFRIGYPVVQFVDQYLDTLATGAIVPVLTDSVITVGTGGLVAWYLPHTDLTFADPTNVAACKNAESYYGYAGLYYLASCTDTDIGNIPNPNPNGYQGRVFAAPGSYSYQSRIGDTGASVSGRVEVIDER